MCSLGFHFNIIVNATLLKSLLYNVILALEIYNYVTGKCMSKSMLNYIINNCTIIRIASSNLRNSIIFFNLGGGVTILAIEQLQGVVHLKKKSFLYILSPYYHQMLLFFIMFLSSMSHNITAQSFLGDFFP